MKKKHPNWQVLGVYLTPFSDTPSHEAYAPFGYAAMCDLLDGILDQRSSTLNADVKVAMRHYTDMVRRHIVGDPEITRLCQQMYKKHKRAIDLIYEHRPDSRAQIRPVVEDLIRQHPGLEQEVSSNRVMRFGVKEWSTPILLSARKDKKRNLTGFILLFGVYNMPSSLDLGLYVMPGPDTTRQPIIDIACANPQVFSVPSNVKRDWLPIYSRPLIRPEAYEDLDDEEREEEIRRQWDEFLDNDLPRIDAALKAEEWILESVEPDEGQSSQGSRFVWGEGDIEIDRRPEHKE